MRENYRTHNVAAWYLLVALAIIVSPLSAQTPAAPTSVGELFFPSGWMGDGAPELGEKKTLSYSRGSSSVDGEQPVIATTITYEPGGEHGWAGIYWQYPNGNWGQKPGLDISRFSKITFRARGDAGGEIVKFVSGGVDSDEPGYIYKDKHRVTRELVLTKEWVSYEISLTGQNLKSVIGAFAWVASLNDNGGRTVKVHLSHLQFE